MFSIVDEHYKLLLQSRRTRSPVPARRYGWQIVHVVPRAAKRHTRQRLESGATRFVLTI